MTNSQIHRTHSAHVQELALPEDITQGLDNLAEDGPSYNVYIVFLQGCGIIELPRVRFYRE